MRNPGICSTGKFRIECDLVVVLRDELSVHLETSTFYTSSDESYEVDLQLQLSSQFQFEQSF